ncbi:MAG: hypothetical protein KBF37_04290 [Saprospiraceae bacterium]|nr:hypothetical protein [Saprospiraceae bacterium]
MPLQLSERWALACWHLAVVPVYFGSRFLRMEQKTTEHFPSSKKKSGVRETHDKKKMHCAAHINLLNICKNLHAKIYKKTFGGLAAMRLHLPLEKRSKQQIAVSFPGLSFNTLLRIRPI